MSEPTKRTGLSPRGQFAIALGAFVCGAFVVGLIAALAPMSPVIAFVLFAGYILGGLPGVVLLALQSGQITSSTRT
jgi:hypothetical protein